MEPIAGASSIVAFRIISASFVFMPSRPPRTGAGVLQLCMQPASAGLPLHFINLQTTFHERFVLRLEQPVAVDRLCITDTELPKIRLEGLVNTCRASLAIAGEFCAQLT